MKLPLIKGAIENAVPSQRGTAFCLLNAHLSDVNEIQRVFYDAHLAESIFQTCSGENVTILKHVYRT